MSTIINERPVDVGVFAMSDSRAVAVVRAAAEALNDGDVDGYLRHFGPSCRRWVDGFAQPLTLTDVGDNLRWLRAGFESLRLEEDLLFGDEGFVCARWRLRGVHVHDYLGYEPKGRPIDVATCEVYSVSGGLVVESWVYGDMGRLFGQISVVEGQGA
jgi:hypothetical protein